MAETLIEEHEGHRRSVIRTAAIYTPGGVIATGLFLLAFVSLISGNLGAIFASVIMGLIAYAVDYEALSAIRDLRAEPVTTEGQVQRIWSKGRIAFFGRVHYLMVGRRVFEVTRVAAMQLDDGDRVRIEHWPHTNRVVSVHRAVAGGQTSSAAL